MSVSRVLLHLAAVVLPMAVAAFLVGELHDLPGFMQFGAPAVMAAQLATVMGWPLFDSAARRGGWWRPALAGIVMAMLTHLLFGPCLMLFGGTSGGGLSLMLLASLGSLLVAGVFTVPAVVLLNLILNRVRRKELHCAAV